MKIIINYAGKEYISKSTDEMNAEDAKDHFYKGLERFEKLEVELENGWLLLPTDAVKACAMQFIIEEGD